MARIAGVDIPREKRVEVALTYIYGIGRTRSADICEALNIGRATRVAISPMKKLSKSETSLMTTTLPRVISGDVAQDIKRKIEIGCFHESATGEPPVRGQRTHTNARTRKGPRKTVAGKKKFL